MSRMSIVLLSLLPATAGGLLCYFCVMAFLNHGGPAMFQVAGGAGAALGFMGAITPILGWVMSAPARPPVEKKKPAKADEDDAEVVEDAAHSGEVEEFGEDVSEAESVETEDGDSDAVEAFDDGAEVEDDFSLSDEDMSQESSASVDLVDEVEADDDFEMFDEVEEEPPAKKNKKKK